MTIPRFATTFMTDRLLLLTDLVEQETHRV